jgi:hypothetical protein
MDADKGAERFIKTEHKQRQSKAGGHDATDGRTFAAPLSRLYVTHQHKYKRPDCQHLKLYGRNDAQIMKSTIIHVNKEEGWNQGF